MKSIIFLLPFLWLVPQGITEMPASKESTTIKKERKFNRNFFRFGDRLVIMEKYRSAEQQLYLLVGLHSNESPVISAAMKFANENDLDFLKLNNEGKKNIEAQLLNKAVSFDPDRILTVTGRKKHLKSNKCWSGAVNGHVFRFSLFVTNEFTDYQSLVSLHSDTHVRMSDYEEGGRLAKGVGGVVRGNAADESFLITNDREVFDQLKRLSFNAVYVDGAKMPDDGSLNVYCNKTGRNYVQVQVFPGEEAAIERMLRAVDAILK